MALHDIGANIRRIMKLRGYSIKELAEKTALGSASISNLLNGKSEPRSSTLILLAKALEVSLDSLLVDVPRLHSVRFRTQKTLSGREKAAKEQLEINVSYWLDHYMFLEEELSEKSVFALEKIGEKDPLKTAAAVRRALNLDNHEPIYDIAGLMWKAGVKLKLYPFGFKKTFGLSIGKEDGGPALIVNSEDGISIERQIFTVAHELGHLILHRESYNSIEKMENKIEEMHADLFASAFLLPNEGFLKTWNDAGGLHWVDRVLHVKRLYKVSYKMVLFRLAESRKQHEKTELFKDFAIDYKKLYRHDLKNHYEPDPVAQFEPEDLTKKDFIEERFSGLVRKAYEKEIISLTKAAEILELPVVKMRDLALSWKAY